MPFFWGEWMSQHGSVIGNRAWEVKWIYATAIVFYPGYSEILTGQAWTNKLR